MANQNGRIYIDTSTTPHKGVEIADLQTVLDRSTTGDLGLLCSDQEWYDTGVLDGQGNPVYALRHVNRINKWAKFKPFRSSAIGFPINSSAGTPELRSPTRLEQALAANFGLTIPRFSASDFKTHYSDPWVYNLPRGLNGGGSGIHEWFRLPDFDGYLHNVYWQLGPVSFDGIQAGYYTIFNGYLSVPRTSYIFPGDLLTFYLQCAEDPDTGMPGLLYPYTFHEDIQSSRIDISKYYIGIAIITGSSNPTLWIKTGDQLLSHITEGDLEASLSVRVPNSILHGSAKFIPVITSVPYEDWDDAPGQGYFIGLDGAYLTRNIGAATSKITTNIVVTYNNGTVTMAFTLTNNTSSDVEVNNLYAYVMSAESFYNEGDSAHQPPTQGGNGVREFIEDRWPDAASHVPPDGYMGDNPPDIYLSDWILSLTPPAYLVARGYNAFPDFRTANGNSTTIRVGRSVTWSKTMNIGQDDGCGYYSDGVFVSLCLYVTPGATYDEEFSNLTD